MSLVDQALAAGDLSLNESGQLSVTEEQKQRLEANLAAQREAKKVAEVDSEDDSRPQEQIILGFALQGTKDNTNIWAKFRSALGLTPGLRVPQELFSDGLLARVAEEVDAAFHGKRDIRTLNGRALVESYRHRLTNEQVTGSLQAFSQQVSDLTSEIAGFVENDFEIAIELLKSKRARVLLRQAGKQLEYNLRADKAVEDVVLDLLDASDRAKQLVKGRLGQDMELDDFESLHSVLLAGMEAEKVDPISTGIRALDIDLQGGVNPRDTGKLNVIGARTGVGKTTVGIAASMGLSLNGCHTLFLSTELNAQEIGARAMSHFAFRNNLHACKSWILEGRGRGTNAPAGYDMLRDLWVEQRQTGLIGDFKSKAVFHASAEDMAEVIMAAKAKDPELSAVFIDHFHALRPSKGFSNRSQEMEARILYLHQAAKAAHVDLFLMAQLNREACLANKPSIEHINGTDAIGQLATAVWLLEFPKREEGAPFDGTKLVCHHAKFRNGQREANGEHVSEDETNLSVEREYCMVAG